MTLAQGGEAVRLERQVEQLRDALGEAEERVRQLEELLAADLSHHPFVLEAGLTRMESRILGALLRADVVSRERLMVVLYGALPSPPDDGVVNVWLCKLRRKLRPFGMGIVNRFAVGWSLDAAARERLKGSG